MRISDWSSDVCSSDLWRADLQLGHPARTEHPPAARALHGAAACNCRRSRSHCREAGGSGHARRRCVGREGEHGIGMSTVVVGSEEHTSELQSIMRISNAVVCLKKHKKNQLNTIDE